MNNKIKGITISYENGTEEVIKKGFVAGYQINSANQTETVECYFCNIQNQDMYAVVMGVLELGDKMGFFK